MQLGVLDIRTEVIGEPTDPVIVFTNREQTAIAVILGGTAAEVTLPAMEFAWLEKGYASLAASR